MSASIEIQIPGVAKLNNLLGPGAALHALRKDRCPLCEGPAIADIEASVTGFIYTINCPIMLELREEPTGLSVPLSQATMDWRDKHGS